MKDIATIIEDTRYKKPFAVKLLKANERYPEDQGRFDTAEEAMKKIEGLGATPVSEYRFAKEISCL